MESDTTENYHSDVTNSRYLRKSYTNKFKRDVVDFYKLNCGTIQNTALHLGICESLISSWLI
jgi:transposase-like protein